jgi:hypothetical protein
MCSLCKCFENGKAKVRGVVRVLLSLCRGNFLCHRRASLLCFGILETIIDGSFMLFLVQFECECCAGVAVVVVASRSCRSGSRSSRHSSLAQGAQCSGLLLSISLNIDVICIFRPYCKGCSILVYVINELIGSKGDSRTSRRCVW